MADYLRTHRWTWVVGGVLLLALIGSFLPEESEPEPAAAESASEPSETPAAVPEPAEPEVECLESPRMAAAIAEGEQEGVGFKPRAIGVVKSDQARELYLFAVQFSATGIDAQVGVWASNALEPGEGLLMSMDGTAQEFTVWPSGPDSSFELDPNDPAVQAARDCLA